MKDAGNIAHAIETVKESVDSEKLTVTVKYNEPLKNYTTLQIGGPVRVMYFPGDTNCAVRLCELLCKHGIRPYVMGNGSNILASDSGLDIAVINTTELKKITLTDTVITADSGVPLSDLAVIAQKNALTGLEFAHGIPGTLGGAVVMNAGAYGGEIKDVIYKSTAYDFDRGEYTVTGEEHGFSYRKSIFTDRGSIILSAQIHLENGDINEIGSKMQELATRRRESQPLDMPSAGSFFKRPKDSYASVLIEQAGLKGYCVGSAQISEKHAGFLVNTGGATFSDVMELVDHVCNTVKAQTGIELEMEARVWK